MSAAGLKEKAQDPAINLREGIYGGDIESPLKGFWRRYRKNRLAVAGSVILILLCLTALFAPVLAPFSPAEQNLEEARRPPSADHWLGQDELGRDLLSRLIYGSRISLSVGAFGMGVAMLIGIVFGTAAGYHGGTTDIILMRFVDLMLSFPTVLLLIILASFVSPSIPSMALIIGFTGWMSMARLVRSSVLTLKEQEYIEAAKAMGASDYWIIMKHLLPNSMAPLIVSGTLGIGSFIIFESALGYLGLGIEGSWGLMLRNGQYAFRTAPWLAIFPGLIIFITVLSINFIGDGLRDAFDPKLRR